MCLKITDLEKQLAEKVSGIAEMHPIYNNLQEELINSHEAWKSANLNIKELQSKLSLAEKEKERLKNGIKI